MHDHLETLGETITAAAGGDADDEEAVRTGSMMGRELVEAEAAATLAV